MDFACTCWITPLGPPAGSKIMSTAYAYRQRDSVSARALFLGVIAVGLSLFGYASFVITTSPLDLQWLLFALVTVLLVSRIDIGIPSSQRSVAVTDSFIVVSAILFGGYPSVVICGLDAAVRSLQAKENRRFALLDTASASLSIFAAAELAFLVVGPLEPESSVERLLFGSSIVAISHYLINSLIGSVVISVEEGETLASVWRQRLLLGGISSIAGALAGCLVLKIIGVVSFYAFIVAVPVFAITYFTYKVYLDKVEVSNEHAEEVADLHLRTIEALAIAIDAKDEVTHDHVHRVQIYATGLGNLLGISEPETEALKAGALLHDIGKLAIPDYILNKPGALTSAEFDKMKVHTTVGAEILERVGFPYPVVPVVRHHHERWDGRGYPDGLRGDQIPITARILSVVDCFDAVREDRQYRKAMTREEAIGILREGSGSVFDPTVVSLFLDHLPDFEAEIRSQGVELQPAIRRDRPIQKAAVSSASAGALDQIRSAHKEVITLYDIAKSIGTSLSPRDTFAVFSSRLADIVSYTTCVLYLVRPDSTEVEATYVSGRNSDVFKGRKMDSGAGITGWVVANGHPMHNCDPRLDFDGLKLDIKEQYRAATVVPLNKDGEILGALALYSVEVFSYTADHLRLVEAVAKLASDAIANAIHHQHAETSMLTDSLTSLPNARALRYRFEEEADRARRHKDVFAVVMMDLDGFKAVNDRLGHQAGDYVLRETSQLLTRFLRPADFLCRYAGDEFVAILHAAPDEAQEIVQRLQTVLDKREVIYGNSCVIVGLSAGWASFGPDGESLDQLMVAADRLLYADKSRRRALATESGRLRSDQTGQIRLM